MKFLSVLWLLAMGVVVAPGGLSAQKAAAKDFDFRGHGFGDEKWDEPLECTVIQGLTTDQTCQDRTSIGDADATVMYWFYGNKLGRVSLVFDPKDFEEILTALREKFGPPRLTASTVSNAMGATFPNQTARWRTASGVLTAGRYGLTIEHGYADIQVAWAEKLDAERKAAVRKRNGI